ncbi:MAG: diguanylate cyclase [Cyanobacteriota/Melainabacteria group bacterium]
MKKGIVSKVSQNMNIRTRMLLLCLGVALPLLAIGSISLVMQYNSLHAESKRATSFQAAIAARTLSQWSYSQLNSVAAVGQMSVLSEGNPGDIEETLQTALVSHNKDWAELALIDTSGAPRSIKVVEGEKIISKTASFVRTETLDQVSRYRHALLIGFDQSPWTDRPGIFAVAPVTQHGELTGYLVAGIKPEAVLGIFTGLSRSNGTVITVIDDKNRVVARTLQNDYWQGKDFSNGRCVIAAEGKDTGTIEGLGIADQTPRAYAFERSQPNDWLVIVGVPIRTIYSGAAGSLGGYDWLGTLIMLSLAAIAISLALAYAATSHFTRTINVLVKEALMLGKGDFTKRVNVQARDELGTLAKAFNAMAEMLSLDKEQKAMVQNISNAVRQSLDLNEILNTTVQELGKNLDASRCCLALLDDRGTATMEDDELIFDYVWHNPVRSGDQLRNRKIPIPESSVLRQIIEQGSLMSLDVLEDSAGTIFYASGQSPDDWKTIKSFIACPISTRNGALGVILVHQCDKRRTWSPYELELVEAVAGQVTVALEHARLYERTKRMAEQEMLINHIVRSVRSSLDLDEILSTVTREIRHALRVERVQIIQPRSKNPLIVTHESTAQGYSSTIDVCMYPDHLDFDPARPESGVVRNSVLGINLAGLLQNSVSEEDSATTTLKGSFEENQNQIQIQIQSTTIQEAPIAVIDDVARDSRSLPFKEFLKNVGSKALIAAPLINDNKLIGLLVVHQCSSTREWKPSEVQLVNSIADQLAIAVTHAHLFAQVRHQAITDGLTGLYNHIYFKKRMEEEMRLSDRKGTSCSLIMIDLDKLKYINDNFGHPVGDAAIRQVADILKTVLRSGDTAARYGGEEFAVILPETSLLEAALIAKRLCNQIRTSPVPGLGQITASMGCASYPQHAKSADELVIKSDRALYEAKNNGRDQVKVYEEEESNLNAGLPSVKEHSFSADEIEHR